MHAFIAELHAATFPQTIGVTGQLRNLDADVQARLRLTRTAGAYCEMLALRAGGVRWRWLNFMPSPDSRD